MNTGYSGTPLQKKLGLKEEVLCVIYNAPKTYSNWFKSLNFNLQTPDHLKDASLDFIHVFCKSFEDLKYAISIYKPLLKKNGMLWVSWPKGSSKIKTELKREPIRNYVLAQGLVDVKVAAIDNDWSGLKFVYRLKDRT